MKLKVKFTLIVSGFVITILVLTAFAVFSHFKKSIKETIAHQQFLMISMLADELDSKIVTVHQLLIAAAKTIPPDAMQNPARAQAFLDEKHGLHTVFDNHLLLFTPSGKILAESPDIGRRGFDLSFREYMINTLKTKKPYISDPYVSTQSHKHPVVMLTVPLFDRKGKITGIFSGSIDLMRNNFLGRISTVKIGKTGYLYLTAADRTLIMHPDKKRILTKQAPGLNRLYDKAIDGFEGTDDTRTSYGVKMVSSSKRLGAKNWILLANYPAAEAYRPIRQAKQYFFIATIIVIIVVFFIISLIIKSLLNPLQLFTRHIEGLPNKTGDNRFLNMNTDDEIGTLSMAFNKMMTEIDSNRVALQRSEELYRTVTEFSSDLVFWIAPDKKVLFVSQNCEKFCGYTQEEFYSTPGLLETIIHPEDRAVWAEHTFYPNTHDLHEQLEFRMVTKSGQVCWISHNCLPVYDKEGNCKGRRGSHRDITERKKAEEGQSRLIAIIEAAPDLIGFADAKDTHMIYINKAGRQMCGIDNNEDVTKYKISDLHPGWANKMILEEIIPTATRDGKWMGEIAFLNIKNGNETPTLAVCQVHKNLKGEVEFFSTIARDITERKKAEVELKHSETFLSSIIEQSPHPMWISDEKGTLIRGNQALYNCFHVTPEEMVGKYNIFEDNIVEEQGFMPLVQEVFEKGSTVRFLLTYDSSRLSRLELSQSVQVVLDVTISPVIGVDQRVINAIIQHFDITQQRETERAVESLSLKNEMLLRSASDGIHILDEEGNIVQVNDAFCRMLGYTPDEMRNMNVAQWDARSSPGELKEKIAYLLKNPDVFETRHRRSDNRVIDVEINSVGVEIDGKRMVFASARDITDRKKAEEQIRQSLREKETLLREVHHRVKNNLAIVSSLLALQSRQINDETLKAMLEDSQQRIMAMALVHEKLYQATNFSQIDFGDYINTIVKELLSTFNIEGKDITTRTSIADIKLELEYAIPCGLMMNELLTNSFKYAFPGERSGEIAISCIKRDDIYTLTIKDNGVGLPEGFDYKQTSTLGLQLVNVLAQQLRGTLQMNSDVGTEAIITFSARGYNDGKKENPDS